jgi:hypothetical protein
MAKKEELGVKSSAWRNVMAINGNNGVASIGNIQ